MTALIGLYLAISDSEHIAPRTAVQRLRRAHSATMHAMERAGSAMERAGRQEDESMMKFHFLDLILELGTCNFYSIDCIMKMDLPSENLVNILNGSLKSLITC